jgi:hypothetical protein
MRWKVEIRQSDIERFRRQCLDPILEQLCDWWERVQAGDQFEQRTSLVGPAQIGPHWRHPFGVYNVLDEGGSTEYDDHLDTGSLMGLETTTNLFSELAT